MKESHARTVVAEIEQSSQQVQEIIQRLESAASRQQESVRSQLNDFGKIEDKAKLFRESCSGP
jgi:hypothetical protein